MSRDYLLVFGDTQNDYPPMTYSGDLNGATRKARRHAGALGTQYDIKRRYNGIWERVSEVGDYDPNRGAPQKPASERAESYLHIRVNTTDKTLWVKQAQREGVKLSEWVVQRLNK